MPVLLMCSLKHPIAFELRMGILVIESVAYYLLWGSALLYLLQQRCNDACEGRVATALGVLPK
jgi:hypothetical protein